MRINSLHLLLILLAPTLLGGQTTNDPSAPIMSWQKEANGFAATLLLTRQPEHFLNSWAQEPNLGSSNPHPRPKVQNAKQAARGEPAVAFVLFTGCAPGVDGSCNATVDFRVLRPDGTEYAKLEEAELWQEKEAPSEGSPQLGATCGLTPLRRAPR